MADGEKMWSKDFDDSESVLRFVQERSDDIERAVIYGPESGFSYEGSSLGKFGEFVIALHLAGGQHMHVGEQDAELILNNGILNRMKIRISFAKTGQTK